MIASLPMYHRRELEPAHNRYWALIRHELTAVGIDSPVTLSQNGDEQQTWTDPALVLSQTCGMPYRNSLHDVVTLIGTPDFAVDGCEPGYYRSAIVVRKEDRRRAFADFESAVFAYNQTQSQSGYAAPFHHAAAMGFWFEKFLHTGQHLASARAVADGVADIASLDAVSWRLMQRYEPFAGKLSSLDWTAPTPGLPYISASGADRRAMFDAVARAIASLTGGDRELLGIVGLVAIPSTTYTEIPNPPPAL